MKRNLYILLAMVFCFQLEGHMHKSSYHPATSHPLVMMPGYENSVKDISMYENSEGFPVLEFALAEQNPVCNYIPLSFKESNNGLLKKVFHTIKRHQ